MNDRIDKFFNERIADHTMTPMPGAWAKVEANLSKKNKTIIWFRAAAALLFLELLFGALIWIRTERIETATAKITSTTSSKEKVMAMKDSNETKELKPEVKIKLKSNTKRKPLLTQIESIKETNNQAASEIEQTAIEEMDNVIENESIAANQSETKKPIVLEFRLDNISTPEPSTKINTIEVADLDYKNGIQKAIGFALDVKNGESPIINLRQAKENLFALNFKKEKKTTTQQ